MKKSWIIAGALAGSFATPATPVSEAEHARAEQNIIAAQCADWARRMSSAPAFAEACEAILLEKSLYPANHKEGHNRLALIMAADGEAATYAQHLR